MSDNNTNSGFLIRTRGLLRRALQDVLRAAGRDRTAPLRSDLPDEDLEVIKEIIDFSLSGKGGEASARATAAKLGNHYIDLDEVGRLRFFVLLAENYGVNVKEVSKAIDDYRALKDKDNNFDTTINQLRDSLITPRINLFRQFNSLDHGIKFLVDMRADLRELLNKNEQLKPVDTELRSLLRGWFDAGFLELRNVTWEAPADLLEKLMAYEAVHEIQSWADLKNRLESDRRCYAFFHPSMPNEPLIFVEVALVNGMANNIQDLLDESAPTTDPELADTAIFYSISNAQKGLSGVSFGDFLIKKVVDHLSHELPNLKTFATLSPIPGFSKWLDIKLQSNDVVISTQNKKALSELSSSKIDQLSLKNLLDSPLWYQDNSKTEIAEPILIKLAAKYLIEERQKSSDNALDGVEHFHLSNGARVERINWLADISPKGIKQSAGMMVNYLYPLDKILDNHESYVTKSEIPASNEVKGLIK
tara:strand:- start:8952 stop:10376 length:1425 start_codon:yes stop_codon:yes gene_type:complete